MLLADHGVASPDGTGAGGGGGGEGGAGGVTGESFSAVVHALIAEASGDDVGEMQVVQRRALERIGLMIGWNRDDDSSVDLADGELAALKPAEIEDVGGRVEIDVGVGCPIPGNLGRRHGAPPGYEFGRPAKIPKSLVDLSRAVNAPHRRSHRA
jgi:hypothetical protein